MTSIAIFAQEEDIVGDYIGGVATPIIILQSLGVLVGYYLIYLLAITIPLASLRLFNGFDSQHFIWVTILWAGGMAISYFSFMIVGGNRIFGTLLAIALIFGWNMLINSREAIADLQAKYVPLISIIVTIAAIPWYGQIFNFQKPVNKLNLDDDFSYHYYINDITSQNNDLLKLYDTKSV